MGCRISGNRWFYSRIRCSLKYYFMDDRNLIYQIDCGDFLLYFTHIFTSENKKEIDSTCKIDLFDLQFQRFEVIAALIELSVKSFLQEFFDRLNHSRFPFCVRFNHCEFQSLTDWQPSISELTLEFHLPQNSIHIIRFQSKNSSNLRHVENFILGKF